MVRSRWFEEKEEVGEGPGAELAGYGVATVGAVNAVYTKSVQALLRQVDDMVEKAETWAESLAVVSDVIELAYGVRRAVDAALRRIADTGRGHVAAPRLELALLRNLLAHAVMVEYAEASAREGLTALVTFLG